MSSVYIIECFTHRVNRETHLDRGRCFYHSDTVFFDTMLLNLDQRGIFDCWNGDFKEWWRAIKKYPLNGSRVKKSTDICIFLHFYARDKLSEQ